MFSFSYSDAGIRALHSFPTRRSSDLDAADGSIAYRFHARDAHLVLSPGPRGPIPFRVLLDGEAPRRRGVRGRESVLVRSEEHTSELQSRRDLVCRLLLEKKKQFPGLC